LLFSAASALFFAVGVTFLACSNQGEGDRCDQNDDNGGDDDCQYPLRCTAKSALNNALTDICCPGDRTQATTTVCSLHAGTADAAAPVDGGGLPPVPALDGQAEADIDSAAAQDAANDTASPDAPADAPDAG
jgi:hypothetical protein